MICSERVALIALLSGRRSRKKFSEKDESDIFSLSSCAFGTPTNYNGALHPTGYPKLDKKLVSRTISRVALIALLSERRSRKRFFEKYESDIFSPIFLCLRRPCKL
jgi:hypothetical protein